MEGTFHSVSSHVNGSSDKVWSFPWTPRVSLSVALLSNVVEPPVLSRCLWLTDYRDLRSMIRRESPSPTRTCWIGRARGSTSCRTWCSTTTWTCFLTSPSSAPWPLGRCACVRACVLGVLAWVGTCTRMVQGVGGEEMGGKEIRARKSIFLRNEPVAPLFAWRHSKLCRAVPREILGGRAQAILVSKITGTWISYGGLLCGSCIQPGMSVHRLCITHHQ